VRLAQAKPRVAVVGAGIAGLACARELLARGAWVTVFEKSRTAGGRAGTQMADAGGFDHGAQYFTVSNHRFEPIAQRWVDRRLVRRWRGRIIAFSNHERIDKVSPTERFVGVPGMSAIGRCLTEELEVRLNTRVHRMQRHGGIWLLHDDGGRELSVSGFDIVCLAMPSPQAVQLLAGQSDLSTTLARVDWEPCWAAMLALTRPSGLDFDGALTELDKAAANPARDNNGQMDGFPFVQLRQSDGYNSRMRCLLTFDRGDNITSLELRLVRRAVFLNLFYEETLSRSNPQPLSGSRSRFEQSES